MQFIMASKKIYSKDTMELGQFTVSLICKDVKHTTLKIKAPFMAEVVYGLNTLLEEAEDFAIENYNWMIKKSIELNKNLAEPSTFIPYSPEEREAFTARLKERLPYWEEKMGLRARRVTIKLMKTRWGSCNKRTACLSINLALCRESDEALDYIIVHELSHLVEANHSPRFWSIVERFCPEWKRIRKEMRSKSKN